MSKKMDIIELLNENSRLTDKQISVITGLSEDEVKDIIKNLEEEKVLLKYSTLVNWEKTEKEVVRALIDVRVTPQQGQGFNAIAERIGQYDEVKSVSLISGGYDLSVEVEGKTMKEIAIFVAERLAPIDGVLSTTTHFILKRYKQDGIFFTDGPEDKRLVVTP
ncbi:Lrp/AsnC family transcriptional regulator [Thermoanaerobacterium thermosaccharolyticum]|uniref:Transcriptional regulator, AsnC family n=2 Tax=Thermoanaerobacterium thermosaccharolyticum TaxID=1517 RepID=D9TQZ2_THETC|nr:Lrp/AsnC family transcriptional regulator [Thermoanaerobacterium thermosaccharolyticum]TCW31626.1 AsnC family transcriptional regulator [Thermohydrogenium kirishiense]ADL69772.1 transcriptional regulator, AsnC family [Thermoanaerobacterium thermosaccharolyticum DSM 571]AGB19949.1 transcriptional regulator [Thermoanaerobacterium thermosaccharolyticum M0795]KAA5806353.1 Lrp/AsnC family transcriptional regulator [Thermoanaerobacterium thermosaccharolyticum]MBE0069988.1 Lrp/AsnC family transcri